MKCFAPTLYNMATVIQSCICILSKLKLCPVIIQPPQNLCCSETWHCEDEHSNASCLSVFAYPQCCFFSPFFAPVLALDVTRWPPLSPPEQTAPCRMDFLYTMPHCVLTPLLDTSGDLRTKKKKEKEKQLAMSRRFFKSPAHHAEKTRLWEVINLWHAYKVVFVQGTTVNIFVLLCFFPLWVRVTPAAPRTAPFAGCCYSGQHPRQFPGVAGEAQPPQEEIRTVCTVVRNKTPCKFLSLKFAIIRSCSC